MIRSTLRRPWLWLLGLMMIMGCLLLTWQTRLSAARAADSELSLRFQQYQLRPLEAPDLCVPVLRPLPDSLHSGSPFGMRHHPILDMYIQHEGVDFGAPRGTPVFATAEGTVLRLTTLADSSTYGISVAIDHGHSPWTGEQYETRYAHLSATDVEVGQLVCQGDLIGYVGTTGQSTCPHLHYEVWIDGAPVDPAEFYPPKVGDRGFISNDTFALEEPVTAPLLQ